MEFKVGDKVIVKRMWLDDIFSEVTEITAAGNVRVKGEKGLFNKEGYLKPAGQRHTLIHRLDDEEYERKKHELEVMQKIREITQYLLRLEKMPPQSIANSIIKLHREIQDRKSVV